MNGKVEMLKMADVVPTPDNPRHVTAKDPKVVELAASIKANGLLYPVICRPHPKQKGKYDLRAGFRRYLAHQVNGATEILAIVRPMDDKTALEVTILENLQRENLTPLEEARGVKALLDSGQDVRTISAEIGKGPQWVIRRAKLMDLSPKWLWAIELGGDCYGSSTAKLELVARFDLQIQDSMLSHWEAKNNDGKEFERFITAFTRRLKSAPWPLDNDILAPKAGACSACRKRSSLQPGLFDDELDPEKIKKNDQCLDADCWAIKAGYWTEMKEAELRKEHPNLVRVKTDRGNVPDCPKDVLEEYQYSKVKKGVPGATPAVVFAGPGQGTLTWIKKNDYGQSSGRPRGVDGKVEPMALKEKMEQLRKRRVAWVLVELQKAINKQKTEPKPPDKIRINKWMALGVIFGVRANCEHHGDWKLANAMAAGMDPLLLDQFWDGLKPALCDCLQIYTVGNIDKKKEENGRCVAEIMGLSFDGLLAEAAKEIPEPKSWAAEKTDGGRQTTDGGKKQTKKSVARKAKTDAGSDKTLCAQCGHVKSEHLNGVGACGHWHTTGSADKCACLTFVVPKKDAIDEKAKAKV